MTDSFQDAVQKRLDVMRFWDIPIPPARRSGVVAAEILKEDMDLADRDDDFDVTATRDRLLANVRQDAAHAVLGIYEVLDAVRAQNILLRRLLILSAATTACVLAIMFLKFVISG